MIYTNLTGVTCTYYGVTFKPNETHEVPGVITASGFFQRSNAALITPSAEPQKTTSAPKDAAKKSTTATKSKSTDNKEVTTDGTDSDK